MDGLKRGEGFDAFSALYERGTAYGASDIKNDTMVFIFKGEKFELPSLKAHAAARFNGYFYEIPIVELRKLAKE